jgi:Rrf2 family protein
LKSSLYGAGAEYALHSLLILATRPEPASVRDLASFQVLPEKYLAKLFTRMKKAGLVAASEGVAGGFTLARPAGQIPVLAVLEAVDPDRTLFACAEIRSQCALFGPKAPEWATAGTCRIHLVMTEAEQALRAFLNAKTLADLVCEFECKAPPGFAQAAGTWFRQRKAGRGARKQDPIVNVPNTKR